MKRYGIAAVAALVAFSFFAVRFTPFHPAHPKRAVSQNPQAMPHVTVVIDDGAHAATYSGIAAGTPFAALSGAAATKNIPLATKKYDFGVFVSGIGGRESTASRAWIYFVNGISGTVAADEQKLKNGDVVLWRYMEPQE